MRSEPLSRSPCVPRSENSNRHPAGVQQIFDGGMSKEGKGGTEKMTARL